MLTRVLGTATGGNQRDLARAKNQKKLAEANKGKRNESNTSIAARKEADAEALRAKQAVSVGKILAAYGWDQLLIVLRLSLSVNRQRPQNWQQKAVEGNDSKPHAYFLRHISKRLAQPQSLVTHPTAQSAVSMLVLNTGHHRIRLRNLPSFHPLKLHRLVFTDESSSSLATLTEPSSRSSSSRASSRPPCAWPALPD